MDHKMAKQKFLTKKYIKNLLSEILYEQTDIRPNNRTIWSEYLNEAFSNDDFSGVYIHFAFEELEDQIKSDFGIKDEISILFDTNYDLENNLYWDNDSKIKTSFNELVNIIYKDIQNELKFPVKNKRYYLKEFKYRFVEPNSWNWIIYYPLAIFLLVIFLRIFIVGPAEAFVDLFNINEVFGAVFGWALLFFFLYLLERNTRKK